jgi:hypothetical protein
VSSLDPDLGFSPPPGAAAAEAEAHRKEKFLMPERIFAVEHVRRMHGGSQAQLMKCSDGRFYVVKFQNNPQGPRILANELLACSLALHLGLPVAAPQVVEVSSELTLATKDMVIQWPGGRERLKPGLCFGSQCPFEDHALNGSLPVRVFEQLPEEQLRRTENLSDFGGMFVFDVWTMNVDSRQVIFFQRKQEAPWKALMIDNGNCFNGNRWNFPRKRRKPVYPKRLVYEPIVGFDSLRPWLERIEDRIDGSVLASCAERIPPVWYQGSTLSLSRLLAQLDSRRRNITRIVWRVYQRCCSRGLIPNPRRDAGLKIASGHSRLLRVPESHFPEKTEVA